MFPHSGAIAGHVSRFGNAPPRAGCAKDKRAVTLLRGLRAIPFLAFGAASVWLAARAPNGRKPFTIAFDFSLDALLLALTKWPHMASMAFLYLLALIAAGLQRSILAATLVFGVGVGWELAQSTVIGHNARIADLLPNAAALTVCVLVTRIGQMLHRRMAGARALNAN